MFWRKKRKEIADDALRAATDIAEKSLTIGPTGVVLLLGAAAAGATATYFIAKARRKKSQ